MLVVRRPGLGGGGGGGWFGGVVWGWVAVGWGLSLERFGWWVVGFLRQRFVRVVVLLVRLLLRAAGRLRRWRGGSGFRLWVRLGCIGCRLRSRRGGGGRRGLMEVIGRIPRCLLCWWRVWLGWVVRVRVDLGVAGFWGWF